MEIIFKRLNFIIKPGEDPSLQWHCSENRGQPIPDDHEKRVAIYQVKWIVDYLDKSEILLGKETWLLSLSVEVRKWNAIRKKSNDPIEMKTWQ